MKKLLIIVFLLPLFSFSQEAPPKINIKDSVEIQNGIGEKMNSFFTVSVPKEAWENFKSSVSSSDISDKLGLFALADIITRRANMQLQNKLSFIPMKNQFISYTKNRKSESFLCIYKCYGRNSYGNLIESEIFVEYKIHKK